MTDTPQDSLAFLEEFHASVQKTIRRRWESSPVKTTLPLVTTVLDEWFAAVSRGGLEDTYISMYTQRVNGGIYILTPLPGWGDVGFGWGVKAWQRPCTLEFMQTFCDTRTQHDWRELKMQSSAGVLHHYTLREGVPLANSVFHVVCSFPSLKGPRSGSLIMGEDSLEGWVGDEVMSKIVAELTSPTHHPDILDVLRTTTNLPRS